MVKFIKKSEIYIPDFMKNIVINIKDKIYDEVW